MIESGIYPHLSNDDYHADPAISRSGILSFMDSPYKYWAEYLSDNRRKKEYTDAMRFGSAFHSLVLEPEEFKAQYDVEPPRVYLKYDGKEAYENYKKELADLENSRKDLLKLDEYEVLLSMFNALRMNRKAWELIEGNVVECSHFWSDPHTEIMCKARPDVLSQNYVIDLKTIKSADPRTFQYAMAEGAYHIQAAMIRDAVRENGGKDIKMFINICVEKTYPYQIGIYIIDDEALEIGRQEYKQALLNMKVCIESNEWPSYEIQQIGLPKWRK